jgi:hypothetical protein
MDLNTIQQLMVSRVAAAIGLQLELEINEKPEAWQNKDYMWW